MAGKFKDFGKKLSDAAKNTAKKSEELIEIGKIKGKIRDAESKIEDFKLKIGEAAFAKFKDGEDTFKEAVELCEGIVEAQDTIADYEVKIMELKHIRICSECGTETEDDVAFCPKCGNKFEPKVEDEAPAPEGNTCESCGAELEEGVAFCPSCGAKTE